MSWSLLPLLVVLVVAALPVDATELCRTHRKTLVVRDACKRREAPLTGAQQVELGFEGSVGPAGPVGPAVGDLKLVDATGAEVGVVTSLADNYGQQSASVLRFMTLPGATAPEFVQVDLSRAGFLETETCSGTLFETPTCTGARFADCSDGSCSSAGGAFFFREIQSDGDGAGCFLGDASEFRRGDFYRGRRVRSSTPAGLTLACQQLGGTLTQAPRACGGNVCARCCFPRLNLGVVPVRTLDAALLGTPPFRLAR